MQWILRLDYLINIIIFGKIWLNPSKNRGTSSSEFQSQFCYFIASSLFSRRKTRTASPYINSNKLKNLTVVWNSILHFLGFQSGNSSSAFATRNWNSSDSLPDFLLFLWSLSHSLCFDHIFSSLTSFTMFSYQRCAIQSWDFSFLSVQLYFSSLGLQWRGKIVHNELIWNFFDVRSHDESNQQISLVSSECLINQAFIWLRENIYQFLIQQ